MISQYDAFIGAESVEAVVDWIFTGHNMRFVFAPLYFCDVIRIHLETVDQFPVSAVVDIDGVPAVVTLQHRHELPRAGEDTALGGAELGRADAGDGLVLQVVDVALVEEFGEDEELEGVRGPEDSGDAALGVFDSGDLGALGGVDHHQGLLLEDEGDELGVGGDEDVGDSAGGGDDCEVVEVRGTLLDHDLLALAVDEEGGVGGEAAALGLADYIAELHLNYSQQTCRFFPTPAPSEIKIAVPCCGGRGCLMQVI